MKKNTDTLNHSYLAGAPSVQAYDKKDLREKFMENVGYIKDIIPDFQFDESKIDKYINDERFKMHERAKAYVQQRDSNIQKSKGIRNPKAYDRIIATLYDNGYGKDADEKYRELIGKVGASTKEGELVRQEIFIDTLNKARKLDPAKMNIELPFDELGNNALDNMAIYERCQELQNINNTREQSLGFGFSQEHENNIKKIEKKGVDLGSVGTACRDIASSPLFMCFPFEDLNLKQTETLLGSLQRHVSEKQKGSKSPLPNYNVFLTSIGTLHTPINHEEPEDHEYTLDDVKDLKPSFAEYKKTLYGAYNELRNTSTQELAANQNLADMLTSLGNIVDELDKLNVPASPEQALCLRAASKELNRKAYNFKTDIDPQMSPDERRRQQLAQNILNTVQMGGGNAEDMFFELLIKDQHREHKHITEPDFFMLCFGLEKQMTGNRLNYSSVQGTAKALGIDTADFVKGISDNKYKWKPDESEISSYISNIKKEQKEKEKQQIKQQAEEIKNKNDSIKEKYGLSDEEMKIIKLAEMSPKEMEELPFMKEQDSLEKQQQALHDYLDNMSRITKASLPAEYADALKEELADYSLDEVKAMALRQGITFEKYMDRMLGKETVELDYGETGQAPSKPAKSVGEQIDEAVNEINEALRSKAANPLESLITENFIEMKEASYHYGSRQEMEKCLANYFVLKTIQKHAKIKNGEDYQNDPQKTEEVENWLSKKDNCLKQIMDDDTFRYMVKTIETPDLVKMTREGSFERLDNYFKYYREMRAEDAIHKNEYFAADRLLKISNYCLRRENYFPDKVDFNNEFIVEPKNPFNLKPGRQAIVTLAMGNLLKEGKALEDILDPFKLQKEKMAAGEAAFEQIQNGSAENRENVIDSYMNLFEKSLEYANKKLTTLDSLSPKDFIKQNDPTIFALDTLMQEVYQDIGDLNNMKALPSELKNKFDQLSYERTAIAFYFKEGKNACEHMINFGTEKSFDVEKILMGFINSANMDSAFRETKKNAQKSNLTMSKQGLADSQKDPTSLKTTMKVLANSPVAGADFAAIKATQEFKNSLRNNPDMRQKLCKDVFNGDFGKKVIAGRNNDGTLVVNNNYLNKFIKAPAKDDLSKKSGSMSIK